LIKRAIPAKVLWFVQFFDLLYRSSIMRLRHLLYELQQLRPLQSTTMKMVCWATPLPDYMCYSLMLTT